MDPNEESQNEESDYEESNILKLDTIPPELFLHICSFLSAKFVIRVLSQVSRQFRDIIQDDTTWRTRIMERWPRRYPIVTADSNFNWKEACIQREEQYKLWTNEASCMKLYSVAAAHEASVDVVLLLKNGQFCASGSRDRNLKLWNVSALNELPVGSSYTTTLQDIKIEAHQGWIWSMTSNDNLLYTGSWDKLVKQWDLMENNELSSTFHFDSPVLCLAMNENLFFAGTHNRIVSATDPRAGDQIAMQHKHHKSEVLCIAADEKFIISGSTDGTLVVFDRIAHKLYRTLNFDNYPMCMSYGNQHLWIGDKSGYMHLIDPTNEKFKVLKTYHSGHGTKVTGIQHSLGMLVTCSTDKMLRIHEPNADPKPIAILRNTDAIACVSLFGNTLVSANCDSSISVWLPNKEALEQL